MTEQKHMEFNLVGCVVAKDDKFLVIEESKSGREGKFNFPGGHIEPSETLAEAAVRETFEESGYEVELTGVVGFYQDIYSFGNFGGIVYLAKVIGGKATPSVHHPSVQWLTKDEIIDLYNDGKIFTKYPKYALADLERRGPCPLDVIISNNHI